MAEQKKPFKKKPYQTTDYLIRNLGPEVRSATQQHGLPTGLATLGRGLVTAPVAALAETVPPVVDSLKNAYNDVVAPIVREGGNVVNTLLTGSPTGNDVSAQLQARRQKTAGPVTPDMLDSAMARSPLAMNEAAQPIKPPSPFNRAISMAFGEDKPKAVEGTVLPRPVPGGRTATVFDRAAARKAEANRYGWGVSRDGKLPELKGDSFGDLRDFRLGLLQAGADLIPAAAELRTERADAAEARKEDELNLDRFRIGKAADLGERQLGVDLVKALKPAEPDKFSDSYEEFTTRIEAVRNPDFAPLGPRIGEEVLRAATRTGVPVQDLNDQLMKIVNGQREKWGEIQLDTPEAENMLLSELARIVAAYGPQVAR